MKISVGIPVYDGKLQVQSVLALTTEARLALMLGHELNLRFVPSCCNLAKGRNHIAKMFLESGDDRLVFLDGDVTFEPGDLVKLAEKKAEFVAGGYRYKRETEGYPIGWLPGDLQADSNGLLEVAMVPTGFLALSRSVLEKFKAAYPRRWYRIEGVRTYSYFEIPFEESADIGCDEGNLYTEDAYFCKMWRAIGGKIYLDPDITLTHWEYNKPYTGHVGRWLRKINRIEAVA